MKVSNTTAMMMTGFSPCPNDTYMFHAMVHGLVPCEGYTFDPVIEDIETLNLRAVTMGGELSLTKLSVGALGRVADRYRVLNVGAALGRGVGPLVVRRKEADWLDEIASLEGRVVAVPGEYTTANLLMRIFGGTGVQTQVMPFHRIMSAIESGRVDAGVVIHEGRFTYEKQGLEAIADLGALWEEETSLPLPLGMICVHRSVEADVADRLEAVLRDSIAYADANPKAGWSWIRANSQELDEKVCRQHIGLYVNEYSRDLGEEGRAAITELFSRGRKSGAFGDGPAPW